jgi:hypothetical protein
MNIDSNLCPQARTSSRQFIRGAPGTRFKSE